MCSFNFLLLPQVISKIVLSEKCSTLKTLLYSGETTSYVFVENVAQFLIKYVHFKELQTCCKCEQF